MCTLLSSKLLTCVEVWGGGGKKIKSMSWCQECLSIGWYAYICTWFCIAYICVCACFFICAPVYTCIFTYCMCASIPVWRQAGYIWECQVSAAARHRAAAASPCLPEPGCYREGIPGPLEPAARGCAVWRLCQLLPEENWHGPGWLWEKRVGLLKGNRITAIQKFPTDLESQCRNGFFCSLWYFSRRGAGNQKCRLWE